MFLFFELTYLDPIGKRETLAEMTCFDCLVISESPSKLDDSMKAGPDGQKARRWLMTEDVQISILVLGLAFWMIFSQTMFATDEAFLRLQRCRGVTPAVGLMGAPSHKHPVGRLLNPKTERENNTAAT